MSVPGQNSDQVQVPAVLALFYIGAGVQLALHCTLLFLATGAPRSSAGDQFLEVLTRSCWLTQLPVPVAPPPRPIFQDGNCQVMVHRQLWLQQRFQLLVVTRSARLA